MSVYQRFVELSAGVGGGGSSSGSDDGGGAEEDYSGAGANSSASTITSISIAHDKQRTARGAQPAHLAQRSQQRAHSPSRQSTPSLANQLFGHQLASMVVQQHSAKPTGASLTSGPLGRQPIYVQHLQCSQYQQQQSQLHRPHADRHLYDQQQQPQYHSHHSPQAVQTESQLNHTHNLQQQQQEHEHKQQRIQLHVRHHKQHLDRIAILKQHSMRLQKQSAVAAAYKQQQQQQQVCTSSCCQSISKHEQSKLESIFNTDDPVLLKWLQAMRFETELESLSALQARTLAVDEHTAGALSIRNSQVAIQDIRSESSLLMHKIDDLTAKLPINLQTIAYFSIDFTQIWIKLNEQTTARSNNPDRTTTTLAANSNHNNLTIINCTPRKTQQTTRNYRPLDELAIRLRNLCGQIGHQLQVYQEAEENIDPNNCSVGVEIDNSDLGAALISLKKLFVQYVDILIRSELANIVRALNYDFSQSSLNRLSSSSSLRPVRPFESSGEQLPLKWALIALWQLTKDDAQLCTLLTERWQTIDTETQPQLPRPNHNQHYQHQQQHQMPTKSRVAKRLDYSTKYDGSSASLSTASTSLSGDTHSLRSDYQRMYEICQSSGRLPAAQHQSEADQGRRNHTTNGALSCALRDRQPVKQVSTIELLIDVIISQPNKHERVDMVNFIHNEAQNNKLIDIDEWDQTVSAAVYTSNQFKVAALRILNHLCVSDQAVKTILKCFSTPPPAPGQPIPENKIIRSIFECYQTAQEHIYQNETMLHTIRPANGANQARGRKRARQLAPNQMDPEEEYSDYSSRYTSSGPTTSASQSGTADSDPTDEGDDAVVKEAIRLLVQLTTPFHRSAHNALDYYTLIGRFSIESLVKYLTNILKSTTSREMLFLSLILLANISFITTEPMKMFGTNRIILEMFRASKQRSRDLELRDQAVTILANTADKNLLDIVNNGGLTFLLSCLESCPMRMANYRQLTDRMRGDPLDIICDGEQDDPDQLLNIDNKPRDRKPIDLSRTYPDILGCACDHSQSQTSMSPATMLRNQQTPISLCLSRLSQVELASMERIHQKTAIAFARMSADVSTTQMVLKYGGVKQLIDMCKFSHKRNHSDTVLVACIAALRRMAKVIDRDTFKHYNALDLIELEPSQAFDIYGSSHQSCRPANEPAKSQDSQPRAKQRLFVSDV